MKKLFSAIFALFLLNTAAAQTEVRLAVHKSFSLPKGAFAAFEKANNAKVSVIEVGGGNELVNKLILSRGKPIADAVYGLDNTTVIKAQQMNLLAASQPRSLPTAATLKNAVAIDYGYVTLNYDKEWFAKSKLPLPQTLNDLTKPQYKNLLVVPNAGTSTPGLAFLLANIGFMGEKTAFDWWAQMRQNGVKVAKDWSEAYYTEFTQNGGDRPLVVSYATSPAAEVFFSKGKYSVPPTGNLFLKGGVFRQVEGAAVLKGAAQPALAAKLVQYLQTSAVQQAIPTEMWVYPAVKNTALPNVFKLHAQVPPFSHSPKETDIEKQQKRWVSQWLRVVVK
ncbi:MAG: thiamine ABC transporter substrate-binding protein [Neisseria sp.]|nr:thiamine ABC transporter substrate-binding protein [Neisseria sp.]